MGSSTAEGYGATFKKGWAQLYFDEYLKGLNPASELINIAKYGYTTYHLSENDFVPPAGRPLPDPAYNITKALSYKPDVIIINLGSNDPANNIPLSEQQDNYKRIVALANAQGVQVWVTTTQPRRGLNTTQVQLLTGIRDWILTYFGDKSINFWNGIATPKDSLLQQYDSGDGVHLNNDGHRLLFNRVVAAGVVETLCKEEIALTAFTVKPVEDKLQLDWSTGKEKNMAQFIIERSTDSLNWKQLGQVAAVGNAVTTSTYTYKDTEILSQAVYYRLNMEAQNGNRSYSKGVKGIPDTLYTKPFRLASFTVTPQQDKLQLDWSTSIEKNMLQFIIERSADSLDWKKIGQVAAVGNAGKTSTYKFTDNEVQSKPMYYRLNIEGKNGLHHYSDGVKGIPDTLYTKPFRLASFMVTPQEDKLQLDWSTSIEKNMLQFIIERSADSLNWKKLGQVAAVGNATKTSTYKFTDTEIQTKAVYYRLNIEGKNGLHHYSDGVKGIPDTLYTIPFRLTSFNVTPKQNKLELQWATRAEKDMKEYTVERSLDKLVWVKAGVIPAAGTSNVNKAYSFADDIPKAIYVYYRLNMSDKQGRKFYSDTLQASGLITGIPGVPDEASAVRITPNPVISQFQIDQLSGYVHQVKIYNQSGALVYVKQDYQRGNSINVSTLPAGLYMVVIDDGKYRLKLMKM
ncbi:GDSL-type esterase/lipase family protein [Chitinophaga defluvii]|uniref:GDSL-type esterase/lipase family protein n=1 Tax=Chitinophaga defluvii TaxID=3163343 RepID=A0ABV2T6W4_9BACT